MLSNNQQAMQINNPMQVVIQFILCCIRKIYISIDLRDVTDHISKNLDKYKNSYLKSKTCRR